MQDVPYKIESRLVQVPSSIASNYDANGSPCAGPALGPAALVVCRAVLVNTPPEFIQLDVAFSDDGGPALFPA